MVRCYDNPDDRIHELHCASKERRRIITKARHGPVRMSVQERRALPYVRTRRVYTPAMKANLLLMTFGSLTDFTRRTGRICEIARQINMPSESVVTLLIRFNNLEQDVENFL